MFSTITRHLPRSRAATLQAEVEVLRRELSNVNLVVAYALGPAPVQAPAPGSARARAAAAWSVPEPLAGAS